MSSVIIGPVLDALGLAARREPYQPPARRASDFSVGRVLPPMQARVRTWATPATELRRTQPASWLNLRHDHGLRLGPIIWLQRDQGDRCWAVAVSEHDVPDHGWYYSVETDAARDGTDVVITGVALVSATAQVGLSPVHVLPGDLDDYRHRDKRRALSHVAGQVLANAAQHHEHHRHASATSLTVHDMRAPTALNRSRATSGASPFATGWISYDGTPLDHAIGASLANNPAIAVR